MSSHATYSPSQLSRILACPGSVKMCASVPKPPTSQFAAEGTRMHEYAEQLMGRLITKKADDVEYESDEVAEAVRDAVYYVYNQVQHGFANHVCLERRVRMRGELRDLVYGTCDVCSIDDEAIRVFDYKFGRGVQVFAENNAQMLAYLSGWLCYLLEDAGYTYKDLISRAWIVTIVQPRLDHYDEWEVPRDAVIEFENDVKHAIASAALTNPILRPGEKQCRWCAGAAVCPARLEYLSRTIKEAMAAEESLREKKKNSKGHDGVIDLGELAALLMQKDNAARAFDQIHEYLTSCAMSGKNVPNYKMVRGTKHRVWHAGVDFGKLVDTLPTLAGQEDKLLTFKLATPAQVEKLLSKEQRLALDDLVCKPEGPLQLVHESNRKKPVLINQLSSLEKFSD